MRVYLPSAFGFSYPATISSVSAEWVDTTGTAVSLSGSPDTQIEGGTVTGRPSMVSAVADASSDVVTITYPEPVTCNGAGAAQFAYLEASNPIPQGAQAILCPGSNTITLNFDDGIIQVGDSDVQIRYRQSSTTADRVADTAGQAVTTEDFQQTSVQA